MCIVIGSEHSFSVAVPSEHEVNMAAAQTKAEFEDGSCFMDMHFVCCYSLNSAMNMDPFYQNLSSNAINNKMMFPCRLDSLTLSFDMTPKLYRSCSLSPVTRY